MPVHEPAGGPERPSFGRRLRRALFGAPRDLADKNLFRHLSVVAFLAWVGLGADGISSSSYGPEEAFRALGEHRCLAVVIAALMVLTCAAARAATRSGKSNRSSGPIVSKAVPRTRSELPVYSLASPSSHRPALR